MKIAICTPIFDRPAARFTKSLADLMVAGTKAGNDLEFIWSDGSILPTVRNSIAERALSWGADWLLWIDSDQCFPPDTLDRLLNHNEPITGCNYARRTDTPTPTATKAGSPVWTRLEDAKTGRLEEVDGLGFGVILTSRTVYETIPAPWFDFDRGEQGNLIGEDYVFCEKARKAGFRIMLDHRLSWQIGHIGERIYTNAETMLTRALKRA